MTVMVSDRGDGREHAGRHVQRAAGDAERETARAAALDALAHAIDDVVVALQEAERPAAAGEVVDVRPAASS